MKYIIIDIDNTICKKHPDRDTYDYTLVHLDTPITPVIRVLEALCNHDDVFPIFITARRESSREVTRKWIQDNTELYFGTEGYCLGDTGNLYLGTKDDFTGSAFTSVGLKSYHKINLYPDAIVKSNLLKKFLKDYNTTKESILCVFDDNPEVNEMWREEGLFVFDVNQEKDPGFMM